MMKMKYALKRFGIDIAYISKYKEFIGGSK